MQSEQINNLISPLGDYIAANITATIAFFIIVVGIILLLAHIILRMHKNGESMKNEFITIIAHKYHTPLTHIKWLSENLIASEKDPYRLGNLNDLHKANEHLIGLTSTLIELTDSDNKTRAAYSFERINICDLVKSVASEFKDLFHEKNIFFSARCPESGIFVKVDKARMEFAFQVFMNNACIYTPPGKNVDVIVSGARRKAVISVTDKGIGIEHSDFSRIFTKFYRAPNAKMTDTEGFGVGLFLAQSIVKRHRGRIEVFSKGPNEGSTFKIILPTVR
jgi:two-component system sensor histidine kinase ResE